MKQTFTIATEPLTNYKFGELDKKVEIFADEHNLYSKEIKGKAIKAISSYATGLREIGEKFSKDEEITFEYDTESNSVKILNEV